MACESKLHLFPCQSQRSLSHWIPAGQEWKAHAQFLSVHLMPSNLGWKLASVLLGRSHPSLLSTYTQERQGVAQQLIDFDREFAAMFSKKPSKEPGDVSEAPSFVLPNKLTISNAGGLPRAGWHRSCRIRKGARYPVGREEMYRRCADGFEFVTVFHPSSLCKPDDLPQALASNMDPRSLRSMRQRRTARHPDAGKN